MHDANAQTLPIEFVRDIFTAMAGTNAADFDDADFAALPAQVQISAFFGTSHGPTDVQTAVSSAFPYPAGTQHVDALVAVRCNGLDMTRYQAISDALRRKVTGSLFICINPKSTTLPPGTASIILLAISPGSQTKKTQPFLKLVVQDEAQPD